MWKRIAAALDVIQFILFISFVLIAFMQVVFRYALNNSLTWAEEITRYLFIWLVFLGSALCIQRRTHIAVDLIICQLRPFPRRLLMTAIDLIVLSLMLVLVREGILILPTLDTQHSSAIGLPMSWVYAAVPVGALLMIAYSAADIYRVWFEDATVAASGCQDPGSECGE